MEVLGAKLHTETFIVFVILLIFISGVFGYMARLYNTSMRVMERESNRDREHDKEIREKNEKLLNKDIQKLYEKIEQEGLELRLGINELNRNLIANHNNERAHFEFIEQQLTDVLDKLKQAVDNLKEP